MRFDSYNVIAQATQPIENPIHRTTASSGAASTSQPAAAGTLETGRVICALVAVLALIILLRWALRRLVPRAMSRGSRAIRVVGRTFIGPKQQVLILQVGRRLLVVGDSGQQLNTLCEINDPDEAAALLGQLRGTSRGEITEMPGAVSASAEGDPALSTTRTELNGLAQRVRLLARHLSKA